MCVCTVVPADDDAAAADGAKRAPLTAATTSTGTTQAVLCCTSSSLSVVVPVLVSVVVVVAVVVMAPSTDFHRRRQHCTDTGANTNTDRHAGHELKLLLWRLQLMEALSFSLPLSLFPCAFEDPVGRHTFTGQPSLPFSLQFSLPLAFF